METWHRQNSFAKQQGIKRNFTGKNKIGEALFVLSVSQLFSLVALQIYQKCSVIININSHMELLEEVSGKFCCWTFNYIH